MFSFVITVDGKGKTSAKWFVYIFGALFCNAFCGITQKIFAMSEFKAQQSGFMIVVFFVGSVAAFVFAPKKLSLPSPVFLRTSFMSGLALGSLNMIIVFIAKKCREVLFSHVLTVAALFFPQYLRESF